MLYKNIYAVAITIYAFLSSPSQGGSYYVSSNPSSITCKSGESCHIYCDEDSPGYSNNYDCRYSNECYFYCNEPKCAQYATIYGSEADNLYITTGISAPNCFQFATVYTPDDGNAVFSMQSNQGLRDLTIVSGHGTKNITINCDTSESGTDSCNNMNVDASNAQFLRINVAQFQQFKESTVKCPVDSAYNPEEAPCVIDATNNGIVQSVNITASGGTPINVVLYDTGCDTCSDINIECDNPLTSTTSKSWYPFESSDACWLTVDPTAFPTESPTINPTNVPTTYPTTTAPTASPTIPPTQATTINPTFSPTASPTIPPTQAPTLNPTFSPTFAPTVSTMSPSASPTNNPTYPTVPPTSAPSFPPTIAPSMSPTFSPTLSPTTIAQNTEAMYVIGGISLLVCLCCIGVIWCLKAALESILSRKRIELAALELAHTPNYKYQ